MPQNSSQESTAPGAPAGSPAAISAAPPIKDAADPGGSKKPAGDFLGTLPPKPTGAQAEEAEFARDGGSVPAGFVPSGGGPVPAGSLPEAEQKRRLDLKRTSGRLPDNEELDEDTLGGMSAPDLRALGVSRGYKMPDAGGRATMMREFLVGQRADERFRKSKRA
jgi:hypothetical protein